jgi:hypothetical protein
MSSAYTVMWAKDRCDSLRKAGDTGKPLTVLFGGIHQSVPSLKRAGVGPGDLVFPLLVHKGSIHIIAGTVVKEFVDLNTYATEQLGLDRADVDGLYEYRITELITRRLGALGHRSPIGCGIEVALVARSTPVRFDLTVPAEQVDSIRFCPRNAKPVGLRHVDAGKLKSAISLHGHVRRLCPDSAELFVRLADLQHIAA